MGGRGKGRGKRGLGEDESGGGGGVYIYIGNNCEGIWVRGGIRGVLASRASVLPRSSVGTPPEKSPISNLVAITISLSVADRGI